MNLNYAVFKPTHELVDGNNVVLEFVKAEGKSELSILQKAVGGPLEPLTHFFPWAQDICLQVYGNKEAATYGDPISCLVFCGDYPLEDPRHHRAWLRGNIVFVRTEEYGGDLTEYDKELIKDEFWWGIDFNTSNPDDPDGNYLRPFVQEI